MQTTTSFAPAPASVRADIARVVTRLTLRPLERVIPDNGIGIGITRRILATMMIASEQIAPEIRIAPVDSETADHGRIKGEWARADDARADGVILYIHGSGYNLCSTRTHRGLVTQIARRTGLAVFSTEYRLAPKHVFPAAALDVERAWTWLLAQGWRADQIFVAGDSAGGHLALDLAVHLLREGRERPAGLTLFSPVADVTFGLAAQREAVRPDPMLSAAGGGRLLAHYVAEADPAHPRLLHVLEPGEVLPPTLIQAGGAEMLAADAHHLHRMLLASGTEVDLEVWPGQMHVFQAASRFVPEAHPALDRAAGFMVQTLARRAAGRRDGSAEVSA